MTFEDFDQLPVEEILMMMGVSYRPLDRRFADILCPYHADRTPSATIYEESRMFVCFACGEKRRIGQFYYDVTGIRLEHGKPSLFLKRTLRALPERNVSLKVVGGMIPVYENDRAMAYCQKRKIPDSFLKDFSVHASDWLRVNGTFMGNRLIIPVIEKDLIVSYEGRDFTENQKPKVLYPEGAPPPLFNVDRLDRKRRLVIVEGLIDFAVLWGYGYRNLSTIMGASISAYVQAQLCEFDELTLFMDADGPGEKVIETIESFYPGKLFVTKLEGFTPEGKPRDPKHGSFMEIQNAIENALPPALYFANKHGLFAETKISLF